MNLDSIDQVILIMLHFKWDEDNAIGWFDLEEQQKFEIGIEFDTDIMNRLPETNASLPSEHNGYC